VIPLPGLAFLATIRANWRLAAGIVIGGLLTYPVASCNGKRQANAAYAAKVEIAAAKVERAAGQAETERADKVKAQADLQIAALESVQKRIAEIDKATATPKTLVIKTDDTELDGSLKKINDIPKEKVITIRTQESGGQSAEGFGGSPAGTAGLKANSNLGL